MTDLTDERIQQILKSYNNKREKEKERYNRIKDSEEFKIKNRERAKNHYQKNKDIKLNRYQDNKEFLTARSSYYYYKKNDKLDIFKEKYPDKIKILSERNIQV